MINKRLDVTRPLIPPLSEFYKYLEQIWTSKILTNKGPMHEEFETAVEDYLGVKHVSLFSNGTTALLAAIRALKLSGEIITTPYTFVATAHSIVWSGAKPIFVDIDPATLNIDPSKIEAAITDKTSGILPVHCYGDSCDIQMITSIAESNNLRVIYDAAASFGVEDEGGSILRHGDLSILSFHATKVFNTFEGGAVISPDLETKQHIDHLRNFGFVNEETVVAEGINGKLSEIHAAFGLLQLKYIDESLEKRKQIFSTYTEALKALDGISLMQSNTQLKVNYSYFPVFVQDECPISRDELYLLLKKKNIFARRYFYPLISEFPMYRSLPSSCKDNLPIAIDVSNRVICLPMYPELDIEDISLIVNAIREFLSI